MSGIVFVNEQKVDKAGEMIKEDAKVEVRGHDIGYVDVYKRQEGIPRPAGGMCWRSDEQRYHPCMGAETSAAGLLCAGTVFQR